MSSQILESTLPDTVYIHSSHQFADYENIKKLFRELVKAGRKSFFFSNDAANLICYALQFSKTNNIEIFMVHNLSNSFYFYNQVTHLFVEDGINQSAYLKKYCALSV